ncbi:hypothetical protein ACB092_07G154300 [Castanea dentata]
MDSCCLNLKLNSHLAKAKGGFCRENDWFCGDRIRGSLKNDVWVNQLAKSLRTEKKARKFRPGVSFAVITSNNAKEAATIQAPTFYRRKADPRNVASIILVGGAGAQLFPLTRRAATPAVPVGGCYRLIDIPMSNCINSGINKICVLTQFNSASLNRHISRTYFENSSHPDQYRQLLLGFINEPL